MIITDFDKQDIIVTVSCVDCNAVLELVECWNMVYKRLSPENVNGIIEAVQIGERIVGPLCYACVERRSINQKRVEQQD